MISLPRTITRQLYQWKISPKRKVLLLRGARQVGKTFIVRKLGASFKNFVEINLLEQPGIRGLFSDPNLDIDNVIESISAFVGTPIKDHETLLFIDEIQASPEAIATLRFFYEKRPHLHVIASGSLLEFALEDLSSFGVARIEYLYMYPLTFQEFLLAQSEELLLDQIKKATPKHPLPELLHIKSLALLKTYLTLGGMPEVLAEYFGEKNFQRTTRMHSNILTGYEDDFVKYKKKVGTEELRETFRSAALQAGKKFIYSHAYRDASSKSVYLALSLLVKAGIVHKVYHTSGNGLPLGSEIDLTRFKTLPLDIGLYNRLVGLQLSDLAVLNPLNLINKGTLAEVYVGLELLWNQDAYQQETLFYWHREAKSSNAEVDYLIQIGSQIFPIEVKASGKGAMHSMNIFLEEKKRGLGIRVSTENFGFYERTLVIPLYAISEISRIVASK